MLALTLITISMLKNMKAKLTFFLFLFIMGFAHRGISQCSQLRPQIDITFNTDQDCAPTTVTDYTIKYFFNVAQNPADIVVRFEWNDPTNAIDNIDQFTGLVISAGDTEFEATGTFAYPVNNDCSFFPTAFIVIAGVVCPTSEQEQTAFSWARDNEFGGTLAINPVNYDVCYGDAVVNAIFTDNSTFNCNIVDEPDNPNRQGRNVQFVYGTNHNPLASIRDLTLDDGAVQTLTDNTGALAMTSTQGTAGLMITAAYFGPVDAVPFPADVPISATYPLDAPANLANIVGDQFEITMFNWNTCNPYNGDPVNPNYDEAISITAYIRIVDAPAPNFQTRRDNAAGVVTIDFCIGDIIYFDNLTAAGGLNYTWEFFDDAVGTPPALATSNSTNPTYSYSTSGQKLIRLSATNPTAQAGCTRSFDLLINLTPTLIADIRTTDLADVDITPDFCQDNITPTAFDVRFYDNASGVATVNSEWRWEFYDENDVLIREEPGGGAYSNVVLGPFDQAYTNPGNHLVRYITRDGSTLCEIIDSVYVRVYNNPMSNFSATRVCAGSDTDFQDLSTHIPINGDGIVAWEWDFDYDGVTFTKDPAFDNQLTFSRNLGAANSYNVALRTVTDQNACEHIQILPVIVDPLPVATFSVDQTQGCSVLPVEITNSSVGVQPAIVDQYIWQIDYRDGMGFVDDLVQDPGLPGFLSIFTMNFQNLGSVNDTLDLRLKVVNEFNCELISSSEEIVIFPAPAASYTATNYNPFADNCGSVLVDFLVDAVTQALSPTQYTWRIVDENGLVQPDVVFAPVTTTFSFSFDNTSSINVKDYLITLTADFPGGCPSDVTQTIRVNPIPLGTFSIDTLLFDCDIMRLEMNSNQKGLGEYFWEIEINGNPAVASNALGDRFEYDFNRPMSGNPADIVEVYLTTTNFANCISIRERFDADVLPQDNIAASFDVSPTVQDLPNSTVTITNTTNSGPWQYLWDFGDGTTSPDPNVASHEYGIYGVFTITLTVTSQFCVETFARSVTINPIPPIVDFDFEPEDGCAPLAVQFTNLTQFAEQDTYVWDFGEGDATSGAVNPTYIYNEPGTYTVTLSASNITGQVVQAIKEQVITVFANPSAFFDVRPEQVFIPNPVYTNNSSFEATSFKWDFGDGTTSEEFEPSHIYEEEGVFSISLIAINEMGCTDTLVVENAVVAKERGGLRVPNAFSPSLTGPASENVGQGNSGATGNDVFLPLMENVSEFQMQIFNRWGELLFESNNSNVGWNGYYKGKLVPQDVYVYKINAVFNNGEKETRVGDVTLIR